MQPELGLRRTDVVMASGETSGGEVVPASGLKKGYGARPARARTRTRESIANWKSALGRRRTDGPLVGEIGGSLH